MSQVNFDLGNGLVSNMRQAIHLTNDDRVYWLIYPAPTFYVAIPLIR